MALDIVLLTGMSGSGKSVALHALEDAGYYCVDNLPPELLGAFVALEHQHHSNRVAIAVDVRSATGLPQLPQQLQLLRAQGVRVRPLFLDQWPVHPWRHLAVLVAYAVAGFWVALAFTRQRFRR